MCWKARWAEDRDDDTWPLFIKDQWRASEHEPEGNFLCRIPHPTPAGLPKYIWHGDVQVNGSIVGIMGSLRNGLSWPQWEERRQSQFYFGRTSKLLAQDSIPTVDRVHTRLVIEPVGRPLLEFTTYTQLLCAIREAIKDNIISSASLPFRR